MTSCIVERLAIRIPLRPVAYPFRVSLRSSHHVPRASQLATRLTYAAGTVFVFSWPSSNTPPTGTPSQRCHSKGAPGGG